MRAHKIGELQRDEETKRAWFTVGQTHSSHIEQSKTYSDEENRRLFGLVDWDVLGETKFVQIVGKEFFWIMMLIFARSGAEAGKAMRIKDENLISWGYFTDHNPFEPHCNAHPNNFIVQFPLKSEHNNLLGMVDLDMAFEFDSFVNTVAPDPMIFTDAENL